MEPTAMDFSSELNKYLVTKYAGRAFMYTEYPHKKYWMNQPKSDSSYRSALQSICTNQDQAPVLLYVHTLHCQKQCYFCTCHTVISNDYNEVKNYLTLLFKEIDLLTKFFQKAGSKPNIKEIHLGGGTPTYMHDDEFDELIVKLKGLVSFDALSEFSIEIDPRRVKKDRMAYYASKGINRVSFGIQDFDINVQKAVNRIQPPELIENLLTEEVRSQFSNGVSFDIICGLPNQTKDSIRKTMERIVKIGPDRICLNYLHMSPKFAPHQLLMPQDKIPGPYDRKALFVEALGVLVNNGYVRTGYDHFAKPTDAVAQAMSKGEMQWNSLGVTPGRCTEMLGIGVHSYSRLGEHYYSQNYFEVEKYEACLNEGKFPIYREYELTDEDILRRHVIQKLRSYFNVKFDEINSKFNVDFKNYFSKELKALKEFETDGIVKIDSDQIALSEAGYQFADMVCEKFDTFYSE